MLKDLVAVPLNWTGTLGVGLEDLPPPLGPGVGDLFRPGLGPGERGGLVDLLRPPIGPGDLLRPRLGPGELLRRMSPHGS